MKKDFRNALLIAGVLSLMTCSATFAEETSGVINVTSDISGQSGNYGGAVNSYDGLVTDSNGDMVMPSNRDSKLNVIDGIKFDNNTSTTGGGAISVQNGQTAEIGNAVEFTNNESYYGGAIYTATNNVVIGNNAKFENNTASFLGGAIYNGSSDFDTANMTIGTGAAFTGNNAQYGGAIYNLSYFDESKIVIGSGATFDGNNASISGGAIYNEDTDKSEIYVNGNTTFSNNTAGTSGGAIVNGSKLTLDTSAGDIIFTNNTANGSKNDIYQAITGTTTITGSNKVTMEGGFAGEGVINKIGTGELEFKNADNSNFTGEYKQTSGTLTLDNSDIIKNSIISNSILNVINDNTTLNNVSYIAELANNNKITNTNLNISNSTVESANVLNVKTGGIKALNIEDSSYNGDIVINNGSSTSITSKEKDSNYTGVLTNNGTLNINSETGKTTFVTNSTLSGNGTLNQTGNLVISDTDTANYTGKFTQNSGVSTFTNTNMFVNSELKSGSETNLEGTSDFAENSTISANGTLNINSEAALKNSTVSGKGLFNALKKLTLDKSTVSQANITGEDIETKNSSLIASENLTINGILKTEENSIITAGGTLKANSVEASSTRINATNVDAANITTKDSNMAISGNTHVSGKLEADNTNIVIGGTTTITDAELNNNSILSMNGNATFDDLKVNKGSVLQFLNPNSTFDAKNGFTVAEGTVNVMNNQLTNNVIESNMTIDTRASFVVDVDPRNFRSDMFTINGDITNAGGAGAPAAEITISDFNLTSVPINRYIDLPELFKFNGNVDENINFVDSRIQKFTPIGWYQMQQNVANDGYRLGLTSYNPQVFRGQVATVASYANQLVTNNIILDHVYLTSQTLMAKENSNKYAAVYPQFAPYQYNKDTGSLWVKSYVNFERLGLTQGLNVGNNAYGTIIGADFPVVEMKDGWKFLPTAFIGYNGAHQTFDRVGMYQNGGQAGFMGTFMKNDFIGSAMIYGGGYNNEMNVANTTTFGSESSYTDRTGNWYAGFAAKSAYNFHPTKHFIIQPTLMASYNLFGQQNWHTGYGDMSMRSNYLNGVNVAPGVNFIYARDTWSLYLTAQYIYNIMGYAAGMAGRDVELPHVRMKHGYIEYGIGATKTIQDRLQSYLQIVLRNGGRTGVGFQLGFSWLF